MGQLNIYTGSAAPDLRVLSLYESSTHVKKKINDIEQLTNQ